VVELTETALLEDEAAAQLFMERLRAMGCKLTLLAEGVEDDAALRLLRELDLAQGFRLGRPPGGAG
jgi:EAL domain-containing protein (putative c-di-GMP-specific phosphodiesterase class I)